VLSEKFNKISQFFGKLGGNQAITVTLSIVSTGTMACHAFFSPLLQGNTALLLAIR
jgi:hypothetical protein